MKIVLVALAIVTLGVAAVPAAFANSTVAGDRAATLQQKTGSLGGS